MKAKLKCNAKAKVKVVEDPTDFILNEIDKSHNHDSLEGPVVAETIQNEMKQEFEKDFRRNPNDIKKKVMNKFKLKYSGTPSSNTVWHSICEYLPADSVICKNLRRYRQKCLGNIPRGREALDHKQILEGLVNEGGEKVKTLDSNEMLESNDLVKSKFENCSM